MSTFMEIFNFIFSNFWTWLGTYILIWLVFSGIESAILAIRGRR